MNDKNIEWENLLRSHKPTFCQACGNPMQYVSSGTYKCTNCGQQALDDFGRIKAYLDSNGPTPMALIARETGVDREIIELYLKRGRIEIPNGSKYYLRCEKCKCEIRYGRYCPDCAKSMTGDIHSMLLEEVGERPRSSDVMKGKMRYINR